MAFIIFNTVLIEIFPGFVLKRHLFVAILLMIDGMGFLFGLPLRRSEWNPFRVHFFGVHEPQVGGFDTVEPANLGLMN